ncbi:MAG TPA: hypothetical protein VG265_15485 [Gaiellaceae bacterium]|nr:hypothetical protein [Gaiellaceae bacterium]
MQELVEEALWLRLEVQEQLDMQQLERLHAAQSRMDDAMTLARRFAETGDAGDR